MSGVAVAPPGLAGWTRGFYGKLPSHGDFVGAGLPRAFVRAWDGWAARALPASRERLGPAWEAAWLEAPVWRFALPEGACGNRRAFGVWMPSVDRVGRYFPLVLAACAADAGANWPRGAVAFLDMAEQAGLAALEGTLPAASMLEWQPSPTPSCPCLSRASTPSGAATQAWIAGTSPAMTDEKSRLDPPGWPAHGALWWTDGAPRVRPCRREVAGLPDEDTFASMLSDGWNA